MNSMTPAGPTANSVFVVTPQNPYPTMPGAMSQGPLYPGIRPQVHLIPRNPPDPEPSACVRPAQRVLKEGKVLGVSGVAHCRPGATRQGSEGGGETLDPARRVALPRPCQTLIYQRTPLCNLARASVWRLVFSDLGILEKRKKSNNNSNKKQKTGTLILLPTSLPIHVASGKKRVPRSAESKPHVFEWSLHPIRTKAG